MDAQLPNVKNNVVFNWLKRREKSTEAQFNNTGILYSDLGGYEVMLLSSKIK